MIMDQLLIPLTQQNQNAMKSKFLLSLLALFAFAFYACEDDGATLYDVSVEVSYPEGFEYDTRSGIPVTMSNMLTGVDATSETNEQGVAEFAVESGNYNISTSFETDDFSFNAISENEMVEEDGHLFELELNVMAKEGGLVFSEVYFAGSLTPEGTNYNGDQYLEIYNNSDEVIYLDGLCYGMHGQNPNNPSQWIDEDGEMLDRIPITFQTWMIPGDGNDYPLEPRSTAVIAMNAFNHQSEENNPDSPVDLSDADFEAHTDNFSGADNPAVPNLIEIYTTSPGMNAPVLNVRGAAVLIFRLPTDLDYEDFVEDPDNFMQNPTTGAGFQMLMVHKDWVIDAVDIVWVEEEDRNKQLPSDVDAGYVWNPEGRGHSIRRVVENVIDGQAVLRNTNNSSEDWIGGVIPTPGEVPSVMD